VQAVELAYKGGESSMTVLLPRKADGLAAVEKGLTAESLDKLTQGMRKTEVVLTLPKFKAETTYTLNDPLKALGMKDAFEFGKADFTGMHTSPEKLFISTVLHKAFVEVNEEGTEAAAATAVVVATASLPPQPVEFTADRPFLFLIRHTPTNTVLFLGRFEKP
jgi:serpin B